MADFFAQYPPINGGTTTNPSVGINGAVAPTSSTEVGGINPSGNLQPLQTDASGNLLVSLVAEPGAPVHVIVDSSALPTGAATETTLSSINTKTPALGQAVMASSTPVVIASDQSSVSTTVAGPKGQTAASASLSVTLSNENVKDLSVTGAASQTATVNNILPTGASSAAATDLTGYRSFSVQVISTGSGGTYIFEGSNDNINFDPAPVYNQQDTTGTPITTAIAATSSSLIYVGATSFQFLRLRIASNITGGSIQSFSKFSQTAFSPSILSVVGTITATNSANGNTGGVVPTQATQVAGSDGANLRALAVDTTGKLNLNNISGTISLPTSAATSTKQSDGSQKTQIVDGSGNVIGSTSNALDINIKSSGATITVAQATGTNLHTVVDSGTLTAVTSITNALPAGTNLLGKVGIDQTTPGTTNAVSIAQLGANTIATGNGTSSTGTLRVAIASDNTSNTNAFLVTQKGLASANAPVQNTYSSVNITTSAYTQLIASTTSATTFVDIFDSSGQAMILATGGAGAETVQAYIPPGGDSFSFAIPAGTRVAYKALTADATSGYLLLNLRG
jgi:hypothetical protein